MNKEEIGYLYALGVFENAYINYNKSNKSHTILKNDIQMYVDSLKLKINNLQEDVKKLQDELNNIKNNDDEDDEVDYDEDDEVDYDFVENNDEVDDYEYRKLKEEGLL